MSSSRGLVGVDLGVVAENFVRCSCMVFGSVVVGLGCLFVCVWGCVGLCVCVGVWVCVCGRVCGCGCV